ncbi:MAG: hypothetical protein ABI602_00865 [Candidatus Saccharibacteria bacterium]
MAVNNPEILDFAQLAFAGNYESISPAEVTALYKDSAREGSGDRVVSGSYRDTTTTDFKHGCGVFAREVMGLDTNHESGHYLFLRWVDEAATGCLVNMDTGEIFDIDDDCAVRADVTTDPSWQRRVLDGLDAFVDKNLDV